MNVPNSFGSLCVRVGERVGRDASSWNLEREKNVLLALSVNKRSLHLVPKLLSVMTFLHFFCISSLSLSLVLMTTRSGHEWWKEGVSTHFTSYFSSPITLTRGGGEEAERATAPLDVDRSLLSAAPQNIRLMSFGQKVGFHLAFLFPVVAAAAAVVALGCDDDIM